MLSNNDYVRNPKTNRPVKVGSRMWRTLVKEGCLSAENFVDEKELYALKPNEDPTNIIQELNKTLPRNKQAVRGRGMYQGKIVKKDKPHDNLEETVTMVKKASVKAMKQLVPDNFENEEDEDSWQTQLENLIMMELVKPKENKLSQVTNKVNSMPFGRKNMSIKNQEETYEEVEVNQSDDDNDFNNDYY